MEKENPPFKPGESVGVFDEEGACLTFTDPETREEFSFIGTVKECVWRKTRESPPAFDWMVAINIPGVNPEEREFRARADQLRRMA